MERQAYHVQQGLVKSQVLWLWQSPYDVREGQR